MRRFVGLWGLVFALIFGSLGCVLSYLRHNAEPQYWLFFAAEENDQSDVYRLNPTTGRLKNLTQTPTHNEVILFAQPAEPTLLMVSSERVPGGQRNYQHIFANGSSHASYNIPTDVDYLAYAGWSAHRQLLFSIQDSEGVTKSIGIAEADGTVKPLTQLPPPCTPDTPHAILQEYEPLWSPDGEWIYYAVQFCNTDNATYRIRPDGSEQQQVLDWRTPIHWSADGQWMLVNLYNGADFPLFQVRPDGSGQTMLTEEYQAVVQVTSDWIYLRSNTAFGRMKVDGADFELLVENLLYIYRIFFNDEWVYFPQPEDDAYKIYRLNVETLALEHLNPKLPFVYFLTASPDNRWVYFYDFDGLITYQVATESSEVTPLKLNPNPSQGVFWLPHPNLPWHGERLALATLGLGLLGLRLQRRRKS